LYKCDDQYPDLVLMKKENLAGGVLELVAQPVEPLVETVARGGTGGLNVPVSVPQAVQTQLVSDLGGVHCIRQVLLVGEDQQHLKPE